jgi:hypothetical protein
MTSKLTILTHKIAITEPSGRELYHLQISLQAASPETFGHNLVHGPIYFQFKDSRHSQFSDTLNFRYVRETKSRTRTSEYTY